MAILRAILAGARDAGPLAPLRDSRCQHDEATMARALQGTWREAHLVSLAHAVALSDGSHQQITACARQIEASLPTFADRRDGHPVPSPPRPRQRGRNQPACAGRAPLHRLSGVARVRSRAWTRRRPSSSSGRAGWIGHAGRRCNPARRGWASVPISGSRAARSCGGGPRHGLTGRPRHCAWPPPPSPRASGPSARSSGGYRPAWEPPRRSRPPPTSARG